MSEGSSYGMNLGLKEDLQRMQQLLHELQLRIGKLERNAATAVDKAVEEETRG